MAISFLLFRLASRVSRPFFCQRLSVQASEVVPAWFNRRFFFSWLRLWVMGLVMFMLKITVHGSTGMGLRVYGNGMGKGLAIELG